MSLEPRTRLQRARLWQIRCFARFLERLGNRPGYIRIVRVLRDNFFLKPLFAAALGFRQKFDSFAQACHAAKAYSTLGHEDTANAARHLESIERLRESDYAVLYHWTRLNPQPRSVLDLGGNIGNLLYSYERYLQFPGDLRWNVVELPNVKMQGERLAAQRHERRIHYFDSIRDVGEVDLFLASGCLHYFDEPLPVLLAQLVHLPPLVFINRVPASAGAEIYTVQDGWNYLVPCKIRNRDELINGMREIGYDAIATWDANEMREIVPLYPESSAFRYAGFYFAKPDSGIIRQQ